MTSRTWKLVPHLLLRRAGFPFGLIERLRSGVGPAAMEAARRATEADVLREQLLKVRFPAEVGALASVQDKAGLKALSGWRKKVGQRVIVPVPAGKFNPELAATHLKWCGLQQEAEAARRKLEGALEGEADQLSRLLAEVLVHPQVRDALFLLVPQVVDAIDGAGPLVRDSALQRRLYLFIQRLASKNETTSFFGPLTHARVDPSLSSTSFGPETATGVHEREAFTAFWAAATIGMAAAMDRELRPLLPVRRISASAVDGDVAYGPDGAVVALEPGARALFAQVDDQKTVAQLAERLGLTAEVAEQQVRLLEKSGFVRRDLEPSSTDHHPLEDVRRRLPAGPAGDRWREKLDSFSAILRKFEQAPLEERRKLLPEAEARFEQITGKSAHRGAGQMYADRTVMFEDCRGDLQPVRLSSTDAQLIEQSVSPALELGATYGRLRHRALVTLATEVLAGRTRVRFLTFAGELDRRISEGGLGTLDAPAARWLERLKREVETRSDGRVARIPPAALAELIDDAGPRFASPDVMLANTPDGMRVVIGEVHPYVFAWGSQNYFAPDPDALQAAFRADLRPWGGRDRMAVVLRRRKHKGLVSDTFPGTFVEVTARSVDDSKKRVAIGDLFVQPGPDGAPQLIGPHGPLNLYVGEDDHPHLRVFAAPLVEMPPVRLGDHTPRIEFGTLVFQRERWELASDVGGIAEARELSELMVRLGQARLTHGWPRFVFAGAPTEPKPVCLDLEVTLAAQHLQRLLREGPVKLIEMVPAPDQLWLRRSSGAHTSELRLGMLRDE